MLSAPDTAKAGMPFTVRVFSYDEKGKRKPAAGAKVTGAAAPTGADGRTTVTLAQAGEADRHARRGDPLRPRRRSASGASALNDADRRGTAVATALLWQRSRPPAAASAPAPTSATSS